MTDVIANNSSPADRQFQVLPTPRAYFTAGTILVGAVVAVSTLAWMMHNRTDTGVVNLFFRLFWLDHEKNAPTFVNFVLLVAISIFAAWIARRAVVEARAFALHWVGISALFLLLAFDEAASVHELLIKPMHALFDLGGAFLFAWTIPALGVVAVLGLLYARFILAQAPRVRWLMIASAAIYLGGALGVEMAGSAIYADNADLFGPAFAVAVTIEETLEMMGLVLFGATLLVVARAETV